MEYQKSDLELRAERIKYEGNLALDNLKRFNDRLSITKGYRDGHFSLHLHICSARPYALEYWADAGRDTCEALPSYDCDFPMLVSIRDAAQNCQAVRSLVRLVRLDSVYVRARQVSQRPFFIGPLVSNLIEFVEGVADRERGAARVIFSGDLSGQFEDHIVQCRTEIVNTIANNKGDGLRERRVSNQLNIGLISHLIILNNDSVFFHPGVPFEFGNDVVKMFIGAFNPFTSAVERVVVNHG